MNSSSTTPPSRPPTAKRGNGQRTSAPRRAARTRARASAQSRPRPRRRASPTPRPRAKSAAPRPHRRPPRPKSAPAPAEAEAAAPAPAEGRRGSDTARRRGRSGQEHVGLAGSADRDQRAGHPGQADDRQPDRHQQPPQAHPRRQDLVHAPDRLRAGAGGQEVPEHEPPLRRSGRQAERGHARTRQPRARDRPAGQGRQPPARRGGHQELRNHAVRPVPRRLRGHRAARPRRQADRRRLWRRDDFADQPGHDRHGALGAAADARAGRDHRRRRDGVPGRVPGREPGTHLRVGRRQAGHVHLDLRPSHHPGCGVRRLPAHRARTAAVATTSSTRSSASWASPTSRCAGAPTIPTRSRTRTAASSS